MSPGTGRHRTGRRELVAGRRQPTGFVSVRLVVLLGAASGLVCLASPSSATSPGRIRVPAPVGTVDTVAGPGFCDGPGRPDPASDAVGDLATDAEGTLWFESGAVDGVLTKVIDSRSVLVVRAPTNSPAAPDREREGATAPGVRAASRVAADRSGGVLFATSTGILQLATGVQVLAGGTSPGETAAEDGLGDGGPVRAARFRGIAAMATDAAGNVYVADAVDDATASIAIRFLNRSGQPVTFYPGTAQQLVVAPGTAATIAGGPAHPERGPRLSAEAPVMAVAGDRLYLGGILPGRRPRASVRLLNLGGSDLSAHGATVKPAAAATIATVPGPARTGGPGGSRPVSALPGIAADGEGNLYLAEPANHRVRRIDSGGRSAVFAGTGVPGFNGNGRPATQARLDRPYDVEAGPGGRVFISDAGNAQVRFVDQGGNIHAALGNGTTSRWVCARASGGAGPARPAPPGQPVALAGDGSGNVYVTTSERGQLYQLAPSGAMSPVSAGRVGACLSERCGEAARRASHLAGLNDVALAPGGGLYLLEPGRARFLNPTRRRLRAHGVAVAPGGIRTVADDSTVPPAPSAPSLLDKGVELNALAAGEGVHRQYTALAADRVGNLFIAEFAAGPFVRSATIARRDAAGAVTTVVAPLAVGGQSDASRCCVLPADLAADEAGNLYILDAGTRRVWFLNRSRAPVVVHGVSVDPGAIMAVAGSGTAGSDDEGIPALEAQLSRPLRMALDGSGNLYVSDYSEHTVHRVDAGGTMNTVVGTGQPGFNGDGRRGGLTALDRPLGLALDACGNLLVADEGNGRVRRLNLVASCAAAGPPAVGGEAGPPLAVVVAAGALATAVAAAAVRTRARRRRRGAANRSGTGR